MVRTIDGAKRRRELAEAVWRIIRREGLDGVTVRAVAAEASLSTGSVRHFFATQDELHIFAMDALVDQVTVTVRDVLDGCRPPPGPEEPVERARRGRSTVAAVIDVLLPLTPERIELFQAQLQFLSSARVNAALAPTAERMSAETRTLVLHLVQSLVDLGAARPDLDVARAAAMLGVVLDGITVQMVTDPDALSPQLARDLVESCLERWEPGS